jgi:hypothetical protein
MTNEWKFSLHTPRKKRSHRTRDALLVLFGLLVVLLFFSQRSRFDLDAHSGLHSNSGRRVVWTGPLDPDSMHWPPKERSRFNALLRGTLHRAEKIRIHVEPQDRYAAMDESTSLRFWYEIQIPPGQRVQSVVCRAQGGKQLAARLIRRMDEDVRHLEQAARERGPEKVDSFTNSM